MAIQPIRVSRVEGATPDSGALHAVKADGVALAPLVGTKLATGDTWLRRVAAGGKLLLQDEAGATVASVSSAGEFLAGAAGLNVRDWANLLNKPAAFAPSPHAASHASGGSDPITPAAIGAAAAVHTHSAADLASGTLALARGGTGRSTVGAANTVAYSDGAALQYAQVTDALVAAAAAIGWSKISKVGAVPGDIGAAAAAHTHALSDLQQGGATVGQVLTWTASGWAPTAASGGVGDAFASVANGAGVEQFAAAGADAIRFAAGAGLAVAFDPVTKQVTYSYTGGGGSGLTAAYATLAVGASSVTATGADTAAFAAAGVGLSAALNTGTKTVTYTLDQTALSIAATQLTGTLASARLSGSYAGITGVGVLTAGAWQATAVGATYGGTGLTSLTKGSILYGSAANTWASLAAPATDGWVLTYNASSGLPEWRAAAGGGASGAFVGIRGYFSNTGSPTIPSATWGQMTIDVEDFDSDNFHDHTAPFPANARYTVPAGKAGKYRVAGAIRYAANSTGSRMAAIRKNGTQVAYNDRPAASGVACSIAVATILHLAVGDYVELYAYQDSGASLGFVGGSSYTFLELHYLGA